MTNIIPKLETGVYMKNFYAHYNPTDIQKNIIIGSLLGDGSLALYGRSKNAYYREHSCLKQLPYREWKCSMLKNLGFKIRKAKVDPSLVSPSHPIYTDLYNKFYTNKRKTITENNIKMLNHPIGLACLYMDDGSLIIECSKKSGKIYIFPRIYISTLNFSKEENRILIKHIKNTFNIEFKFKYSPYGYKNILELNKRNELFKFINLVKPYVEEIPSMAYKIHVKEKMKVKYNDLCKRQLKETIILSPVEIKENKYSLEEESIIIQLKEKGITDKDIAKILNRTYYGVVDKIRRLRNQEKIKKSELSP